jgi:dTDP-4-amino-4,6-dideoxygalactose transaminase
LTTTLGLLQLKHIEEAFLRRKEIDSIYRAQLAGLRGITCLGERKETAVANYSYFPIMVHADYALSRDALYQRLKECGVFSRRYFYPLISDFPMYRSMPSAQPGNLPVAVDASRRILCLPIYPNLQREEQQRVIDIMSTS